MRQRLYVVVALLTTALATGCTSHLVFLENSHMGLKASFEPNNPTPAEVDIGWRRAMFAMVPQKSTGKRGQADDQPSGSVTVTHAADGTTQFQVVPDPHELMSMYTIYKGNIGFNDPVRVFHFLATGVAASNLVASQSQLRALVDTLQDEQVQKKRQDKANAEALESGDATRSDEEDAQ